jgi:Fe-S oxidoreductase
MFIEEDCILCGECLAQCPCLELPLEDAQEEIARMVRTRESSEKSRDCAGCSYCDVICPTEANPSHLIREIRSTQIRIKGASCLSLMTDAVPCNIMSIGLEFEKEEKAKNLDTYLNPAPGKEVFYLGCSISHIFTDLAKTRLLEHLPKVGGMKFCCGGDVYRLFGEEEAKIKGRQLLEALRETGIERMITFCPGCDEMISDVYPKLIPEFDIEAVTIVEYLLDQHRKGEIEFTNPINRRVTFHDPCTWRMMASEVHDNPRRLLELMGAEVVEMTHNRRESMCCGAPLSGRNPRLASALAGKRVSEAKETGAEAIVVNCTGCFALLGKAEEQNLEVYNITELAQMAIGEEPPHRIGEIDRQLRSDVIKKIVERPEILSERYVIRNGKISCA